MHEDDGDRRDALGPRCGERRPRGAQVERRLDSAVGAHPLRNLGHARIEHGRLLDLEREDFGPRLITDLQRFAEPLGDQ